ncbi:MAG: hypothetical protein A3F16_01365 [Deltaproteobacteria bacterium RIFCSPHIGHO2_12_FULL_43_9]|nr:MAG: hypothetical protein A3F16_01365 [Deltaproteobacteria bacterium RIFCSPHIGHO2_12_FULL_43_9]
MKRLKKEEFTKQFRKAHTDLERIKLAIREDRYTIWTRKDKPNFPDEYLLPILSLPDTYKTTRHKRKSGEQGLEYVVELKYTYNGTGRRIPIYLKGFFSKDGHLIIGFEIQSLRRDE